MADGSNAAAWAQAWLSGLAIIASGTLAVYVPWYERRLIRIRSARDRLSITTRRNAGGGLLIQVSYKPRHLNVGTEARVSLVGQSAQRLHPGLKLTKDQSLHRALFAVIDNVTLPGERAVRVRLTHDRLVDPPDIYTGAVFVLDPATADVKSLIAVEIWTDAQPRRLTRQRFPVSAVD